MNNIAIETIFMVIFLLDKSSFNNCGTLIENIKAKRNVNNEWKPPRELIMDIGPFTAA